MIWKPREWKPRAQDPYQGILQIFLRGEGKDREQTAGEPRRAETRVVDGSVLNQHLKMKERAAEKLEEGQEEPEGVL